MACYYLFHVCHAAIAELTHKDTSTLTTDNKRKRKRHIMKPKNTPLYTKQLPTKHHQKHSRKHQPKIVSDLIKQKHIQPSTKQYQDTLNKSGYSHKLEYNPAHTDTSTHTTDNRRKRKRHITWYNPPYSHNTTTNIGKKFLDIIDTCFPPTIKEQLCKGSCE